MAELVSGIICLINTFHRYSKKEGDPNTLTKGELKELFQNELGDLRNISDKDALEDFLQRMDIDSDNQVDFTEYTIAVASIAMTFNEFITKELKMGTDPYQPQ